MSSRLKGDPFVSHHMHQMKLCNFSDIPTNAVAGQRMDNVITKFMHSHMLPFTLTGYYFKLRRH
jgi:hypothetical protein